MTQIFIKLAPGKTSAARNNTRTSVSPGVFRQTRSLVDHISPHLPVDWLYLVGGFNPSEKYEFVSWDNYSHYMEVIKFHGSKPPISIALTTRDTTDFLSGMKHRVWPHEIKVDWAKGLPWSPYNRPYFLDCALKVTEILHTIQTLESFKPCPQAVLPNSMTASGRNP